MGRVHFGVPKDLVSRLKDAYNLKVFIETGTFLGDTARWASEHFKRVITVEVSEVMYQKATSRTHNTENIEFHLGSSRQKLREIVPKLDSPAIFWLDAHWCSWKTGGKDDECPLLEELEIINASPHEHFILIDDARLFLTPPPPPHNPSHWPNIGQVEDVLNIPNRKRFVDIYDDVIYAVPNKASKDILTFYNPTHPLLEKARNNKNAKKAKVKVIPDLLPDFFQRLKLASELESNHILPRGLIYVGVHTPQSIAPAMQLGANKSLFVEANPVMFEEIAAEAARFRRTQTAHSAIGNPADTSVQKTDLFISENNVSSAILPYKSGAEKATDHPVARKISVPLKSLDTLLSELALKPSDYNLLILENQGAELQALEGAKSLLPHLGAICTEVFFQETYEGGTRLEDLDQFLLAHHFHRVSIFPRRDSYSADALYIRQGLVTMANLNKHGRFANQLFRYAFIKIYAQEHNLQIQIPSWIGEVLYGFSDPPVTAKLPEIFNGNKSEVLLGKTTDYPCNQDIFGYFQYHTRAYAPHKEFIQNLFKPIPAVEEVLTPALVKLREKGHTVVGLHIRRGDYTEYNPENPTWLNRIPTEWYQDFLKGFWETLDNPVLFIASDNLDEVLDDFKDYNPVTVRDLGVKFPPAPYFPDFYLLSQCDYLAISNSTFSFFAAMLNQRAKSFLRPHYRAKKLIPFDPWNSKPLFEFPRYGEGPYR